MAKLSWGKPTIEIAKIEANGFPFVWKKLPEIVKDTAKLLANEGGKQEAIEEGGAMIDARREMNRTYFEVVLFVKKGDVKPIEDNDGVVSDNYAIRLTPEDDTTEGFIMGNTIVNCTETWNSAEGKRWKYTFNGLTSPTGGVLKPYPPMKTFRFFSGNVLKFLKVNENSIFRFLIKK